MRKFLTAISLFFCLISAAQTKKEVDRGFEDEAPATVAAKGTFMIGGTAGLSSSESKDYEIAIIKDSNTTGYNISVSPEFCWFFAKNMGVGLRVEYSRVMMDIPSASLQIQDIAIGVKDYNLLRQTVSETAFVKFLLPIGRAGRMAMYVDVGLRAQQGQEKVVDAHTGYRYGTWKEIYGGGLVVRPGLMAFVARRLAVSAGIGMGSIGFKSTRQIHNQVDEGRTTQFSASYLMDLTSLTIGLDFYL